jgi:hypothetical protein
MFFLHLILLISGPYLGVSDITRYEYFYAGT